MKYIFLILTSLFIIIHYAVGMGDTISLKDGNTGIQYNETVRQELEIIYKYIINPATVDNPKNTFVRVEATTGQNPEARKCPTHFVIRQSHHVYKLELPQENHVANLTVYYGARTLCINPEEWEQDIPIYVSISTCSKADIGFSLQVTLNTGYLIGLDDKMSIVQNVRSTAPVFYSFKFPKDETIDTVTIVANSTTKTRTFLSIQELQCPVQDGRASIKYKGRWHSMSRMTALVIEKKDFASGFHIVFLPDDSLELPYAQCLLKSQTCSGTTVPDSEIISFQIFHKSTDWSLALSIPLVAYLMGILLSFIAYSYSHQLYIRGSRPPPDKECAPPQVCGKDDRRSTKLKVNDLVSDKHIYKYLSENSYRYFWTMFIVVLFFGLPITRLILNVYQMLKRMVELDSCNFNYFCSHPYGIFVSFNRVYSLIGFPLLGLTFMIFVHKRATRLIVDQFENARGNDPNDPGWSLGRLWNFAPIQLCRTGYGAYQNFGVYYTLGFAMIMAGMLKSIYNLCPNSDTAFFGTSFMFVIVLLCQIKIYNLRHPCMVTDNFTFGVIGVVLAIVSVGSMTSNISVQNTLLIATSICTQLSILIMSSAGYSKRVVVEPGQRANRIPSGAPTTDEQRAALNNADEAAAPPQFELITTPKSLFVHILFKFNYRDLIMPDTQQRIVWPILRLSINIGVMFLTCVVLTNKHFSTKVYILMLCNFLLDFIHYFIFLKCYYNEYKYKISWQPTICLILAIIAWGFAIWFLFVSMIDWALPSMLFQESYKDCVLFGFYDYVDMYHLTAASALFFTFMVMLTADDAMSRNPCEMVNLF